MNPLRIADFMYELPDNRIARYPLSERDHSKLLVYRPGNITHDQFFHLGHHLPENSLLVFNDTKVIPARLHFQKHTGAWIEIFLLNPVLPSSLVVQAMEAHGFCTWKCTIGNLKKWTDEVILTKTLPGITLTARLVDRQDGLVEFAWESQHSFAEVVHLAGATPLPPYLHRDAEPEDQERYQTIYSHHDGAVAAPTAGLHFTDRVFEDLTQRGIAKDFVTLHVSAGTFQPVKTELAAEHTMHHEQVIISRKNMEHLLEDRQVIAVGTTSMRTLESLYWFGARLCVDPEAKFDILQDDPYGRIPAPSTREALQAVLRYMDRHQLDLLMGRTAIYIMPGYTFRICRGLITNFHQPGSTLMLLVAALVGDDWKKIYTEALTQGYRFLSYGDSSLLLPRA